MPTTAEAEAKRALRASMSKNKEQVLMAEETLRVLRDGDRLNAESTEGQEPPKKNEGVTMEQKVINVLAGIVFASLGWWSNNIWASVQSMQNQVTQLNVELARNYVPRLELQGTFDRINAKLDTIEKQTKGAR